MSCSPWPELDWKVSGDGLLTFFGGLLAFFAVLLQVWRADKGLQKQLDTEKRLRAEGARDENLALARALLTELDHFYIGYVRTIRTAIDSVRPGELFPLRRMPSEPFSIYRSCGANIGRLPPELVVAVVRAYSGAQWLTDRVSDYRDAFSKVSDKNDGSRETVFAKGSLRELPEIVSGTAMTLSRAASMLCGYLDVSFDESEVVLAEVKMVETKATNKSKN